MLRVVADGKLVAEIIPELRVMDHYNVQLGGHYGAAVGNLAVLNATA